MINSIEDINIANGNIILDGYAFLLGMDSTNTSVSLLLLGVNSGNEVWPDIEQINRPDVNTYFLCEYNYKYSGFRASLEDTELKDDECYEIIINIDYSVDGLYKVRKTVSSNRFILNGKLYVYNPSQFDKPDLELQSELLRKVFSDGQLCFYQKEDGMYVYQYEEKLYWIANGDFEFDKNGQTIIPYYLYTSQIDKLPVERVQYKFDNLDFHFEQYEYKDEVTAPYRVAIRDIPDDYAITNITTGHYDFETKTWFWKGSFHLDDLFNGKND